MKICMIGTGYVGLVSGVCFADIGNTVCCVDKDKKKIDQLNKDNKWKEIEFFKSNYIASKDVNAWLGLYEVIK